MSESFEFYGKRACGYLGKSRWTLRRYRKEGKLPNRTCFSKEELDACLAKLQPRERPGAAERIHVARKKNTTQPNAAPSQGETPPAAPPSSTAPPPEAKGDTPAEPPARSPEPKPEAKPAAPASSCKGADDPACHAGCPHHLDFPPGKPWKGDANQASAKKKKDRDGWENPFEDEEAWDPTE